MSLFFLEDGMYLINWYSLGTIHILRKHILDFLDPPPLLRKHVFSTENKQKLAFSDPPPPYKCLRYIEMVPRQYRTGPAGPRKKDHCPLSYLPYLHNTGTLCPNLICYLGKKSVSGIVKHCTESAPHSSVQWHGVCLEIAIFDYQLESYCIGLL